MRIRVLLILLLVTVSISAFPQVKAKAISYAVTVDLTKFAPDFADELTQKTCSFEVDAYYTGEKVRTIVRVISRPPEYEMGIRQRLYDVKSKNEYNIDHDSKYAMLKLDQNFKLTPTGEQKTILGYACKKFTLTDFRKVGITLWVTDKLPGNVCPAGNYSIKGTALEVETSNGLHYLATDMAEGQLAPNFFDVPQDYRLDTVPAPAAQKSK